MSKFGDFGECEVEDSCMMDQNCDLYPECEMALAFQEARENEQQ